MSENDERNFGKFLKDSLIEVADHTVNLLSDSEVLGEIPIIKYVSSVNKLADTYKSRKMHKNAIEFLSSLDPNENEIVIENEDYDEFVDTISLILIESEKPIKAKIVGNLTRAYGNEELDFDTFNQLCLIVFSASIPAIYNLALCANDEMFEAIGNLERTDPSRKSYGIAPNISTRIVGVTTVTHLLNGMGVLGPETHLNGYGVALIKYGKMNEIEKKDMSRFRSRDKECI